MKCKLISMLAAFGLTVVSFNAFAQKDTLPLNHQIDWGADYSKLDQGDIGYPVSTYGLFIDYKYHPLNNVYVNVGLSGSAGRLKLKKDETQNDGQQTDDLGHMSTGLGKFYGNVGYRFAMPALGGIESSVTPYLGFLSTAVKNAGKTVESKIRVDLDTDMVSAVGGVSLESQVCSMVNIGLDFEYHRIMHGKTSAEIKFNDVSKKYSDNLQKNGYWVTRVPVHVAINDTLGVVASYQYTGDRTAKMKVDKNDKVETDIRKIKMNEHEVKLGLAHKF